ncbi:MAG TPA: hypothetical protein VMB52_05385 [Verrucomicrobiae bacterium]|nr:hypothetical protein [Verrucomicrobiae bacterium]
MNDLDDTLKKHPILPARTLPSDFNQNVLAGIEGKGRTSWIGKMLQRLRTKLGLSILGAALLIGGSAAANTILSGEAPSVNRAAGVVVLRPTPRITALPSKQLPDGDSVVGFATQDCESTLPYVEQQTTITKARQNIYFDLPQNSPLGETQLYSTLQAECEENISDSALYGIYKSLPSTEQGQLNMSQSYVVSAVSDNSITVSLDPHYSSVPPGFDIQNQTYTRFATNFVVYDQSAKSSFSAIHAGDDVKMITQYSFSLTPQEVQALPPGSMADSDPRNQIVEAIMKTPPLTGDPDMLYTATSYNVLAGNGISQLVSCNTNSTGFCELIPCMRSDSATTCLVEPKTPKPIR